MTLPAEGFVLEYAPGRLVVGAGPLEPRPARAADRLACYAPDFFLDAPAPWLHPTAWEETTREALRRSLSVAPVTVRWDEPDRERYAATFHQTANGIATGTITKAVPVVLEHGSVEGDARLILPALLAGVLAAPDPSLAYAVWTPAGGMVGASPEILFRHTRADTVETVAIAGTCPIGQADRLAGDPKEVREHQTVVDDVVDALRAWGEVVLGPREILLLPGMAHLKTEVTVRTARPIGFDELVRALHPTAALGVAPRRAGLDLLRALDRPDARHRFGAPFGVEWPDGRAVALVAIRNVQWTGTTMTLGAGAGLIAESRLEREWDELHLKRVAVKTMLGL